MLTLSISSTSAELRPTAAYGAAILHALARDEARGRRRPRLTEDGLATWNRFRHLLGPSSLIALLAEDAAVTHPVPFDAGAMLYNSGGSLGALDDKLVEGWLRAIPELDLEADSVEYVQAQARLLDLPDRMARADLHRVQPHHKILELPGTGGQLCHYLAIRDGIYLQDNATVACNDRRELTLAGLIAVELGAPDADFACVDPELEFARHETRRTAYNFVVGRPAEKGGSFKRERLRELFPNAAVVLV